MNLTGNGKRMLRAWIGRTPTIARFGFWVSAVVRIENVNFLPPRRTVILTGAPVLRGPGTAARVVRVSTFLPAAATMAAPGRTAPAAFEAEVTAKTRIPPGMVGTR